jgi:parallel beta-helix repeat protein
MHDGIWIKVLAVVTVLSIEGFSAASSSHDIQPIPVPSLPGGWLYVGGSGLGNYSSIQAAIDNASDGDTVFVYEDSSPYLENIRINKSITVRGENQQTTVIDGQKLDDVVQITADNVILASFTLQHSGFRVYAERSGVLVTSSYVTITDTIIKNTQNGITLLTSTNVSISNTTINLTFTAIHLYDAHDNTLRDNRLRIGEFGLVLDASSHNTIERNTIQWFVEGICVRNSDHNNFTSNTFLNLIPVNCSFYGEVLLKIDRIRKINDFIDLAHTNIWRNNFWNRPRALPKLIVSKITVYVILQKKHYHDEAFSFDWKPAIEKKRGFLD